MGERKKNQQIFQKKNFNIKKTLNDKRDVYPSLMESAQLWTYFTHTELSIILAEERYPGF